MATQHRPSRPPLAPSHRLRERAVLGLVILATGLAIFRAILRMGDDLMLALLAPVVVFLSVASLFAGNNRRRL